MITRGAQVGHRFLRRALHFPNARSAFRAVLAAVCRSPGDVVLLPSYIGWSPREGSGVFDPVRELGLDFAFYRMDERLRIDADDLDARLQDDRVAVLLIIHYFGWVDPASEAAIEKARSKGIVVVEDEAHAMLTDLVGGSCGRWGDVALFSLHKLLPLDGGGTLVVNPSAPGAVHGLSSPNLEATSANDYDFLRIAETRRSNASRLSALLPTLGGDVEPLWSSMPDGIVPQTFPIRVLNVSRDLLYERMNAAGFGVVSLYHTLVDEIPSHEFAAAHALSRAVLNLPVHQDIELEQIGALVERLGTEITLLKHGSGDALE